MALEGCVRKRTASSVRSTLVGRCESIEGGGVTVIMKMGYTRMINVKGRQIWIPRPLRLLFAAEVCPRQMRGASCVRPT